MRSTNPTACQLIWRLTCPLLEVVSPSRELRLRWFVADEKISAVDPPPSKEDPGEKKRGGKRGGRSTEGGGRSRKEYEWRRKKY